MKKIILFALAVLVSASQISAQSFSVEHDTTDKYVGLGMTVDMHNSIANLKGSTLEISWRVVDAEVDTAWGVSICDNITCYSNLAEMQSSMMDAAPLEGNAAMDLKVSFTPNNTPAGTVGWLTVRLMEKALTGTVRTATFIARQTATGVANVTRTDDDVVLYPNPAKEELNLIFNNASITGLEIYNQVGQVMSAGKVSGNSATIKIGDYPAGMYFVRLSDSQGKVIATRKLLHQ